MRTFKNTIGGPFQHEYAVINYGSCASKFYKIKKKNNIS